MKYIILLMMLAVAKITADEEVLCRSLHIHYDIDKLVEELSAVEEYYMPRHAKRDNWTAIPLRNATGTNTREGVELHHSLQKGKMLPCLDTEFLEMLPYTAWILQDIAERFDAEVGLVRLSKVASQKVISPHVDGKVFDLHKGSICRLHIPIVTGEEVIFEIEGNSYHFEPGTLYYTNVSKTHAVYNRGDFDRIHLIIDVQKNSALQEAILTSEEVPNY